MLETELVLAATLVLAALTVQCADRPGAQPKPSAAATKDTVPTTLAPAWNRWQDPSHRFAIDLPGKPIEMKSSRYVDYGEATELSYFVVLDNRTLGVMVTLYPKMMIKNALPGQVFAAVRKQVTTEIEGTVTEDKTLALPSRRDPKAKLDGRQLVVESESMRMVSRNRWILDGVALYRIMDSSPTESSDTAAFERMVNSFTILTQSSEL